MLGKILNFAFEYETQKMVQVPSKKIGAIYRFIQLIIIFYLIFWVMLKDRGYQKTEEAVSGVTAKVKGISFLDVNSLPDFSKNYKQQLFDAADYVIPPQQNSAFFVATNLVVTRHQKQSTCDEGIDIHGAKCDTDHDCVNNSMSMLGNGKQTGRCINSTQKPGRKVCEIFGWCPTEHDVLPLPDTPLISQAPNFTVLLKNSIEFPKFKVKRRNILPWMNKQYLHQCTYEPNHLTRQFCPIFRLGDILKYANADTPLIWLTGGMVTIYIKWKCDLDYSLEYCVPKYSFSRLDDPDTPIASGWNFRYSYKFVEDKVEQRKLIKAYGIQFFIIVYGRAYKFDWYTLSMNVGSGIGLLGLATVICDIVVLNLLQNRSIYRDARIDSRIMLHQHEEGAHSKHHLVEEENVNIPDNKQETDQVTDSNGFKEQPCS